MSSSRRAATGSALLISGGAAGTSRSGAATVAETGSASIVCRLCFWIRAGWVVLGGGLLWTVGAGLGALRVLDRAVLAHLIGPGFGVFGGRDGFVGVGGDADDGEDVAGYRDRQLLDVQPLVVGGESGGGAVGVDVDLQPVEPGGEACGDDGGGAAPTVGEVGAQRRQVGDVGLVRIGAGGVEFVGVGDRAGR